MHTDSADVVAPISNRAGVLSAQEVYGLRSAALSPDPEIGPVALGRLLDGLAPRIQQAAARWATTLRRPSVDINEIVQELQLHLAVHLEESDGTTPHQILAWVDSLVERRLLQLQHAERRAAARQTLAHAAVARDVSDTEPHTPASHEALGAAASPSASTVDPTPAVGGIVGLELSDGDVGEPRSLAASRIALSPLELDVLRLRAGAPRPSWRQVAKLTGVSRGAARRIYDRAVSRLRVGRSAA